MLIALTAYLIMHFGSGASSMLLPFDQLEKAVKHLIADDAHRKQALRIVEQMKATEKDLVEKQKKAITSLDKKLGQRTVPASDIERAIAPMSAETKAARARLLELRFELKSVLSAGEWAEVFPTPTSHPGSAKKNS